LISANNTIPCSFDCDKDPPKEKEGKGLTDVQQIEIAQKNNYYNNSSNNNPIPDLSPTSRETIQEFHWNR